MNYFSSPAVRTEPAAQQGSTGSQARPFPTAIPSPCASVGPDRLVAVGKSLGGGLPFLPVHPLPGPEGTSPGAETSVPHGQGPIFPVGQQVAVDRFRCVSKREEDLPIRTREAYQAKVVRQSSNGMVYLRRPDGRVGVVHPSETTAFPIQNPETNP